MGDSLIDFSSITPEWEQSNPPLIPSSNVDNSKDGEGSNPFDLIAYESAICSAAADDPFEIVFQSSLSRDTCQEKSKAFLPSKCIDSGLEDSHTFSIEEDHSQPSTLGEVLKNCVRQSFGELDEIPPPDLLQSSILDISDYLDVSLGSVFDQTSGRFSASKYPLSVLDGSSSLQCRSPGVLFPSTAIPASESFQASPYPVSVVPLAKNMSKEDRIEWIQKSVKQLIVENDKKTLQRRNSSLLTRSLSFTSEDFPSMSTSTRLSQGIPAASKFKMFSNDYQIQDFDYELGFEKNDACRSRETGALFEPSYVLKDFSLQSSACSSGSSEGSLNRGFSWQGSGSFSSNTERTILPVVRELTDDVFKESDTQACESLENKMDPKLLCHLKSTVLTPPCEGKVTSSPNIPKIFVSDAEGMTHSVCSPSTLSPLPLCEDAVRKLSLHSKHSPTGKRETIFKAVSSNVQECPKPIASGTRLHLRKPSDKMKAAAKGPLKAVVPVQNMTRKASSKPVSPNSIPVSRIPPPSPKARQLSSPVRLRSSTNSSTSSPFTYPRTAGRPLPASPARLTPNKLPAAIRHPIPSRPNAGHPPAVLRGHLPRPPSPGHVASRTDCRVARPGAPASNLRIPSVKPRVSSPVALNSSMGTGQARSRPSSIPGCRSPRTSSKSTSCDVPKENLGSKASHIQKLGAKPRVLADVNGQPSPVHKAGRLQQPPRPRSSLSMVAGKENVG